MRRAVLGALLLASLAACRKQGNMVPEGAPVPTPSASSQSPTDEMIASEFLRLELSGWRLPDPEGNCRAAVELRYIQVGTYGNYEQKLEVVEVPVDSPPPRILSVTEDPSDPTLRKVTFEITRDGKAESDSFVFVRNLRPDQQGWGSLRSPPARAWITKGCR